MKFTTLDYYQYLLFCQINYTVTNLADHLKRCSHDTINLLLKNEKITSRMLWKQVKLIIQTDEGGYLLFDDTVIDQRFATKIELTRRQYSGNERVHLTFANLRMCQKRVKMKKLVKSSNKDEVNKMTPSDQQQLKAHLKAAAKILYRNTDPTELKVLKV